MSKILFVPFRVLGGVIAGIIGKKAFEVLWGAIDHQDARDPKHEQIAWQKLIPGSAA